MADVVEVIKCQTAHQLLDALHPRRGNWSSRNADGWFFRGHGDSNWKLLPSAFRGASWRQGFAFPGFDPLSDPTLELWERMLMLRFCQKLDQAGMQIPRGDEVAALLDTNLVSDALWPDRALEPLLALAQHHGIPTRLLDWTRSRKVAAYFAAVDALEKNTESLDVWALNRDIVELFEEETPTAQETNTAMCNVVKPFRYGNANLHAQAGVFTLCRGSAVRMGNEFIPLDTLFGANPFLPRPCLRRFQLPSSEARALLSDLQEDQIDAVTLFPGYSGVVRAMHEDHWLFVSD